MRILDYDHNIYLHEYIHSRDFELDKWVYIGVSFFRTDRLENNYNIHIVSKTYSGVQNIDSFYSQDILLNCFNATYSKMVNDISFSNYIYGIGNLIMTEKIKFTGINHFSII